MLEPAELAAWDRAAELMYVPHDPVRGITPQDATFLSHERWDLADTSLSEFPLLLHHHPLTMYRRQVLKQADVVMAMFLLGNEFSADEKRRNFDYYDPITTGDSSLSASIQSIVASEIGNQDAACHYLDYAVLMDLADVAGNTSDGVHIASAAGAWMALVFGFGGVRDFDGQLTIDPRLPRRLGSLGFSLRFRDRQLRIRLSHVDEQYSLDEGDPLEIVIRGTRHRLTIDSPIHTQPPAVVEANLPRAISEGDRAHPLLCRTFSFVPRSVEATGPRTRSGRLVAGEPAVNACPPRPWPTRCSGSADGYSFEVARSDGRAIEAVSQRRTERCGRVGFSVHRVHDAGRSCGPGRPLDELVGVGVHRERGELDDLGADGDVLAEHLDVSCAVFELRGRVCPRPGSRRARSRCRDRVVARRQMVEHTATRRHPRRETTMAGYRSPSIALLLDVACLLERAGVERSPFAYSSGRSSGQRSHRTPVDGGDASAIGLSTRTGNRGMRPAEISRAR